MTDDDRVTLGELSRRLKTVEEDLRRTVATLGEIKVTLASQGVRVSAVWSVFAALALSVAASVATLVTRQ